MTTTYIDSDFVLNATNPSTSNKPLALTNSQLTTTTQDLSYNRLRSYSPGRYSTTGHRTVTSPTLASEIRRSLSPRELKRALVDTAEESRSRSRERRFRPLNNRLQRSRSISPDRRSPSPPSTRLTDQQLVRHYQNRSGGYSNGENLGISDASFKEKMYRHDSNLSTWSTHPVHLTHNTDPQSLRNSLRLGRSSYGRSRSPSPQYRPRSSSLRHRSRSGSLSELRSLRTSRTTSPTRLYEDFPLTGRESLAKDYFPVTMSAYRIEHMEPPLSRSMTTSPPPKHMRPKPEHKWRVDGKLNETRGLASSHGATRASKADEIGKMYTMTEIAPSIAASTVHMVSPYAGELASLRFDRLRIEEDHLLEMKRLAEIERLRGPKAKWYELKTPDFHYEAQKNNELLASKEKWQTLLDYRKA